MINLLLLKELSWAIVCGVQALLWFWILLSERDKKGRHHFRFLGKNETCRQQTARLAAGEGGECADSRINNIYVHELAPRSCRVAAALWQMLRAVAFLLFWSLVALVLSVQSGFPIYFLSDFVLFSRNATGHSCCRLGARLIAQIYRPVWHLYV